MVESDDYSYYPSEDDPQVIRHYDCPPAYAIFPSFPGVSELVNELDMPKSPEVIYNLSYLNVEDFLNYRGYSYVAGIRKCLPYTVELFGLLVKLPEGFCFGMTVHLPDPSLYKCQPRYWIEHGFRPVQIWRLRVLTCSIEDIETNVSNPFGKFPTGTLYFEERWHPLADTKRMLIGGIEKASKSKGIGLDRLYKDALGILGGSFDPLMSDVKKGRRTGTTYYTEVDFPPALKEAYWRLYEQNNRQKPKQIAVANELKISRSTLRRYLIKFNVPWPDVK